MFLTNKNRRAFLAYKDFDNFWHPADMSIINFFITFDRIYFDFKEHGMDLPDAVLTFRLLDNKNISENNFNFWKYEENIKEELHSRVKRYEGLNEKGYF